MTGLTMSVADPPPSLSLHELVRELERVGARLIGDGSVRVGDIRQDSRRIAPGDLFASRPGERTGGRSFVPEAVAQGAVAVLLERGAPLPDVSVPVIEVSDVRLAIALAAEAIHGFPTRSLGVVGITGTNGKTTTSFLVQHAIGGAGGRPGRLGTLGFAFGDEVLDASLTTPEADEISRFAARVRDRGGTHLVMEASSHALGLVRVEALRFTTAAFTNLTQDHLDFHGTMEAYGAAKRRLFTELWPRACVINVDDPFGERLAGEAVGRVLRVGRRQRADVHPLAATVDAQGIRARVALPSGEVELESRLVGEHNLDNLLLALGIVESLGLDVARAAAAMKTAPFVPGRLERCDGLDDDLLVLVDYSHTPDALERGLQTVRGLTAGNVICVFGCGGDRDPLKRPKMGDAVGRRASRAIITNDNPRSEEPAVIARAIEPGLAAHRIPYQIELDRAAAIERAILTAEAGDVVLIAGKGHETYQLVGEERRSFDDRVEARRALALRRERRGG